MKRLCVTMLIVGGTALAAPCSGRAQTTDWTGYVTFNGGYQPTATTFSDAVTFEQFVEQGSFKADYKVKAGPAFDFGAGVRVWNNLGVGVSVSLYNDNGAIPFRARLPHPFFFNRHRDVSGAAGGERRETGAHIDALYLIPASDWFRIAIFGGRPFFWLSRRS